MSAYFSVIIPLYNKVRYIRNTIQSVLSQSFPDFELIVVDDGSTDSSLHRAKSFHDSRIKIYSIENQGVSHARNFGISKASSEYIAFLDADDYWHSSFLYKMKQLIESYPDQSVYSSALKVYVNKKKYKATYQELPSSKIAVVDYFKASQDHSILHCSCSVFKRSALDHIGNFNEGLKTGEDTEYWIRTGLQYPVVFINEPLATLKVVPESLSMTNRSNFKAMDFEAFQSQVKNNIYAKRFLNQNIFTSALRYKLIPQPTAFKELKNQLDFKLLNMKQKILLITPVSILKMLIALRVSYSNKKRYF